MTNNKLKQEYATIEDLKKLTNVMVDNDIKNIVFTTKSFLRSLFVIFIMFLVNMTFTLLILK